MLTMSPLKRACSIFVQYVKMCSLYYRGSRADPCQDAVSAALSPVAAAEIASIKRVGPSCSPSVTGLQSGDACADCGLKEAHTPAALTPALHSNGEPQARLPSTEQTQDALEYKEIHPVSACGTSSSGPASKATGAHVIAGDAINGPTCDPAIESPMCSNWNSLPVSEGATSKCRRHHMSAALARCGTAASSLTGCNGWCHNHNRCDPSAMRERAASCPAYSAHKDGPQSARVLGLLLVDLGSPPKWQVPGACKTCGDAAFCSDVAVNTEHTAPAAVSRPNDEVVLEEPHDNDTAKSEDQHLPDMLRDILSSHPEVPCGHMEQGTSIGQGSTNTAVTLPFWQVNDHRTPAINNSCHRHIKRTPPDSLGQQQLSSGGGRNYVILETPLSSIPCASSQINHACSLLAASNAKDRFTSFVGSIGGGADEWALQDDHGAAAVNKCTENEQARGEQPRARQAGLRSAMQDESRMDCIDTEPARDVEDTMDGREQIELPGHAPTWSDAYIAELNSPAAPDCTCPATLATKEQNATHGPASQDTVRPRNHGRTESGNASALGLATISGTPVVEARLPEHDDHAHSQGGFCCNSDHTTRRTPAAGALEGVAKKVAITPPVLSLSQAPSLEAQEPWTKPRLGSMSNPSSRKGRAHEGPLASKHDRLGNAVPNIADVHRAAQKDGYTDGLVDIELDESDSMHKSAKPAWASSEPGSGAHGLSACVHTADGTSSKCPTSMHSKSAAASPLARRACRNSRGACASRTEQYSYMGETQSQLTKQYAPANGNVPSLHLGGSQHRNMETAGLRRRRVLPVKPRLASGELSNKFCASPSSSQETYPLRESPLKAT
jgi:hypothetical protein